MKIKLILVYAFLLFSFRAWSQIEKGDKLYQDYKYAQAIEYYKPEAEKGNIRAIRKIAECYKKINDYENAEKYYALVVADKNAIVKSFFYYGQALMNTGKYDTAYIWLEKYLKSKPGNDSFLVKNLMESCLNAGKTENANRKVKVWNFESLNTAASEFGIYPVQEGFVFTSTRQGKLNGTSGSGFQQVFFAKPKGNAYTVESIKGVMNTKNYNSGPACIDTLKGIIYYTKNNFQYGDAVTNKKGDVTLKIFSAEFRNDNVKNQHEMEFNEAESSCAFPSINKQGNVIYFTSDRGGGYGGKDIYFSVFQNGKWSKPKNAGKNVNTSGDERYPFIHPDGTLYFSSNGLTGYGGMDIYKCTPNKIGEFGKPENMGSQFNSPTDDFAFYLDDDYNKGYFASDRAGGKGMDDIYAFQYLNIPFELNFYSNTQPLDSVQVCIEKDGKVVENMLSTTKINKELDPDAVYVFEAYKDGYLLNELRIKTSQKKQAISKSLSLTLSKPEAEE